MKRLAVFTEGQTEQIFVRRLIEELAGAKRIAFDVRTTPANLALTRMNSRPQEHRQDYDVLLYDCRNDDRVKSVILDSLPSLTAAGYDVVLGLRDLYPRPLADLENVKRHLRTRVPTAGIPVHILLAVAEVEAWFIQEDQHFQRIDPRLDPGTFQDSFGFDPRVDCAETIANPAALLHEIYRTVGQAYRKTRYQVQRTVDALDYGNLYLEKTKVLPHFSELTRHLDAFFT